MTRDDEKDRLGDKLRDIEKAREDEFFSKRNEELLRKLRQGAAPDTEETVRQLAHMRCPRCGEPLAAKDELGVTLHECPSCLGLWFDKGELEEIGKREKHGWLARYLGLGG